MTTDQAAQQSVEQARGAVLKAVQDMADMMPTVPKGDEERVRIMAARIPAGLDDLCAIVRAEADDLAAALNETAQWFHHTQHNWTNAVESYRDCAVLPCQTNRALLARREPGGGG